MFIFVDRLTKILISVAVMSHTPTGSEISLLAREDTPVTWPRNLSHALAFLLQLA